MSKICFFCIHVDFVVAVILWCCVDTIDAVNGDKKQNSMQRKQEKRLDTLSICLG